METSLKGALVEQPPSTSSENNIEGHTSVNGRKTSVNVPKTKTFPAWIYCTRYSDRPSCSGKKRILLGFTKQLNFCIAPIIKTLRRDPKKCGKHVSKVK